MIFRSVAVALFAATLAGDAIAQQLPGVGEAAAAALRRGEWPAYAGTNGSLRYSPLDLINMDNAGKLEVVWRWQSPDRDLRATGIKASAPFSHESTPIMIGRTLYTSTSLSQIAAIDAATGKTRWVFDPHAYDTTEQPANLGWTNMGVAYWKAGDDQRILILTGDAFLVAVDARAARPLETFASNGRIERTQALDRSL